MILTILAVEGETREVFEDINLFGKIVFYTLSFAATALFFRGWWKRIAKYRGGRPAGRIRHAGGTPSGNGRLAVRKPRRNSSCLSARYSLKLSG